MGGDIFAEFPGPRFATGFGDLGLFKAAVFC
jgi:hypothetical protein